MDRECQRPFFYTLPGKFRRRVFRFRAFLKNTRAGTLLEHQAGVKLAGNSMSSSPSRKLWPKGRDATCKLVEHAAFASVFSLEISRRRHRGEFASACVCRSSGRYEKGKSYVPLPSKFLSNQVSRSDIGKRNFQTVQSIYEIPAPPPKFQRPSE